MDIWYVCSIFSGAWRAKLTSYFTDGGGPSVMSQLVIINEIMHRIQWILKLDSIPLPCEYSELMVGSGLGAYVIGFTD
jgi:hypothetical protein